jgi:hypothetical protein
MASSDELIARAEIYDVLMTYCRAVDRGDVELLRSIYWAGAQERHGGFRGTGHDFASYIVEKMDAPRFIGQHHITNISYRFDGPDEARVESYFLAFQPYIAEGGPSLLGFIGGRYHDRFERRQGRWKVLDRLVILDWSRDELGGETWPGAVNFPFGARRSADADAAFLD